MFKVESETGNCMNLYLRGAILFPVEPAQVWAFPDTHWVGAGAIHVGYLDWAATI
jgi:hypothetical protein